MSDASRSIPNDPRIRLTLALADYSVRRLAPVVLERIAAEIETCGHPVIPGAGVREWESLDGIAGSFRRTGAELKESAPLATEADADRAYKILDNVRAGAKWVEWPDQSDPGGHIQDWVVHAMLPASNVGTAVYIADMDPQEWHDQYGTRQDAAVAEQLAHALADVRRTAAAVRSGGVHADDLDALLDLGLAEVDSGGALSRGYMVIEVGSGYRDMQAPQTQRFPKNAALPTHVSFDKAAETARKLSEAQPHRTYRVISFQHEPAGDPTPER